MWLIPQTQTIMKFPASKSLQSEVLNVQQFTSHGDETINVNSSVDRPKISSCKGIIMRDKLKYMMRNVTRIPLVDAQSTR